MAIDRVEVNRALAKALAFKACGKNADALDWARRLVHLLECAEILDDGSAARYREQRDELTRAIVEANGELRSGRRASGFDRHAMTDASDGIFS